MLHPSSLQYPPGAQTGWARGLATLVLLTAAVACGDSGNGAAPPGGPGAGGPPMAMGVDVVTLAPRPIDRTTEYIATVRSRRSSTIQPQVEGFITSISARAGQRVGPGAVLMEIDAGRQQAAVASLESVRAAREAEVQWARQQAARMKTLFDAGAVSQQEYEQAATAVQTSQAQLQAVEAQIREQRVELGYHRVTAPTAGVVGDIPVRVGERVTRQTVLTTIDENAGLELYINVPVAQAPSLRTGLPVRLVDDGGVTMATTTMNFVSPSVDPATQSVLAKAPLAATAGLRTDQFVRVHIVWASEPALTVPLVSVTRVNGQYFGFVAEAGEGGGLVARQRALDLGPVVGNDYVVQKGLSAGERLIVSGVQKIGDGMPVQPAATTATPGAR